MKKTIRRIKPPKNISKWHVEFRHVNTGIAVDISYLVNPYSEPLDFYSRYNLARTSYLIPIEQIKLWSKSK